MEHEEPPSKLKEVITKERLVVPPNVSKRSYVEGLLKDQTALLSVLWPVFLGCGAEEREVEVNGYRVHKAY